MKGMASPGAKLGLAVLALGLGACDGVPANPTDSQVEIIDWWTAGGEKDAINALLTYFQQQYPNETPLPTKLLTSNSCLSCCSYTAWRRRISEIRIARWRRIPKSSALTGFST